jgi:hypothetical protein
MPVAGVWGGNNCIYRANSDTGCLGYITGSGGNVFIQSTQLCGLFSVSAWVVPLHLEK